MSGAMAKGAYELGAIRAISEYFPPEEIKYISSSSVGALVSYAYSSGHLDEGFKIWRNMNRNYPKLFVKTVLESNYFKEAIERITENDVVCEKFYVALLNLNKHCNRYVNIREFDKEKRATYLRAATAFTPLVKPVLVGDEYYVDGAFVDNIPVYPLTKHKLDYIICIHFDKYDYTFESQLFDRKIIKIVYNEDTTRLKNSIWITRESTEQMFEAGYKKAKHILDFVFSCGTENVENVYEKIEVLNSMRPKKQMRLTGDIVFNNLTKITRRFATTEITG